MLVESSLLHVPPLFPPLQLLLHAAAGPRAFSTDSAHVETLTLFVSHYHQMKVEGSFCPVSSPKLRIIAGRTSLHKSTFQSTRQGTAPSVVEISFSVSFHFCHQFVFLSKFEKSMNKKHKNREPAHFGGINTGWLGLRKRKRANRERLQPTPSRTSSS